MAARSYWLDLFTGKTWQEFLAAGGEVTGFRAGRRSKTVRRIRPGDYLLCYLTGVSRFIAALEATSDPYVDDAPIWSDEEFPERVRVRTVVALTPETAVPIGQILPRLSIFDPEHPRSWGGRVRGSPARWSPEDGEAILEALQDAERNPVSRPVDAAKLGRRPRALRSKEVGEVTIPQPEAEPVGQSLAPPDGKAEPERVAEVRAHTEIQGLLLKLGADMGLDVFVARSDRGREVDGRRLSEMPRCLDRLPVRFEEAVARTIENIDVLWLKGRSIEAAFEIESTTSIYSGLLRMSDLLAMQPNLNIPLFIVAPDERREKVISEVNRPTFSRLSPPMVGANPFSLTPRR
jgi:hypothetical protein